MKPTLCPQLCSISCQIHPSDFCASDAIRRDRTVGIICNQTKAFLLQTSIRHGLLLNLGEPVPQVATQLAVLIGKIARVDCPREWGDLLPALFQAVRSTDQLVQHRTLLTLHHVVKQLASKRLAADRRTFQVKLIEKTYLPIILLPGTVQEHHDAAFMN